MKYEYMISPFEYYDFDNFSKKEAGEYFKWHIEQIKNRLSYLQKYIVCEGKDIVLDYTKESLIPLWSWHESKITCVIKTEKELNQEQNVTPQWLHDFISNERLTYETIGRCVDVAIYFAETIIKNSYGHLEWGYFTQPKNKVDVNRPVVLGFVNKIHLNPIMVVYNCTLRSSQNKDSERLYNIYSEWMKFVK